MSGLMPLVYFTWHRKLNKDARACKANYVQYNTILHLSHSTDAAKVSYWVRWRQEAGRMIWSMMMMWPATFYDNVARSTLNPKYQSMLGVEKRTVPLRSIAIENEVSSSSTSTEAKNSAGGNWWQQHSTTLPRTYLIFYILSESLCVYNIISTYIPRYDLHHTDSISSLIWYDETLRHYDMNQEY